ncbi:MAG: cell division protein FtsQ/DivIB [Methylophilaceae bacterium]|nr:cell division protein FtsQ/DivIB [Methylophilaceae bacterium]MBL6726504.1 cell division protein FtsQ/DivIB [Methylophilaceae bacterium]MBL6728212.1 cell division protein FtsQ/DivIB [Methylophilaceae bacterium]MBL6790956.1 cell division protein FtsQ/DivIB [Methylophilaceae bacterium]
MLNDLQALKRLTLLVYLLIIPLVIFLIQQSLIRSNFPINEIQIKNQYEKVDSLQVDLIIQQYLRGNFFGLDLNLTRNVFKKLPWVREVSVRRIWPDKIEISIEEHQVIARWGNVGLVNDKGEFFNAAYQDDLPYFWGPKNFVSEITQKYFEINKILSKELMQIGTISMSDRLSWEIQTDNNIKIVLGRKDILKKITNFVEHYQTVLTEINNRIEYVDMRYKNGFAIKKLDEKIIQRDKEKATL